MIPNGTRPLIIQPRRVFHERFGSIASDTIPDFNVDTGLNGMPDQIVDGAPTECTGYTVADILTDVTKTVEDPDFSYAAALYLEGISSGTAGADFHLALQGAVAVGVLPSVLKTFSAKNVGELYASAWTNYPDVQKKAALQYVQNGTYNVLGNGDAFSSILSALYTGKIGISVGTPWFFDWEENIQGGIVQTPNPENFQNWHNWAIKGKKTINGIPYLMGKSWQGTRVGDNGWLYYSREAINTALAVQGSGAITIATTGSRWASLVGILLERYPQLFTILPKLISL